MVVTTKGAKTIRSAHSVARKGQAAVADASGRVAKVVVVTKLKVKTSKRVIPRRRRSDASTTIVPAAQFEKLLSSESRPTPGLRKMAEKARGHQLA